MKDKIDPTIYDKDIWLNGLIDEVEELNTKADNYVPFQKIHYQSAIEEVLDLLKSKLSK